MERKSCWYSIIRYCNDVTAGELINIGIILHSNDDDTILRYNILDEGNIKIRSLANNKVDLDIYKVKKDYIEFALEEASQNMYYKLPEADKDISVHDRLFLVELRKVIALDKIILTEPTFAKSQNLDTLFERIFSTYVGSKFLSPADIRTQQVKKVIKEAFESRKLMSKIKTDFPINPIPDLDDLVKVQIDFAFKNGLWNYMRVISPKNIKGTRNTDWIAKTKLLVDSSEEMELHLMYQSTDDEEVNEETNKIVSYFERKDSRVKSIDLTDQSRFSQLCDHIAKEAHDIRDIS